MEASTLPGTCIRLSTPVSWDWLSVWSTPGRPNSSRSPERPAPVVSAGLAPASNATRAFDAASAKGWSRCFSTISWRTARTSGSGVPASAWTSQTMRSSFFLTESEHAPRQLRPQGRDHALDQVLAAREVLPARLHEPGHRAPEARLRLQPVVD